MLSTGRRGKGVRNYDDQPKLGKAVRHDPDDQRVNSG